MHLTKGKGREKQLVKKNCCTMQEDKNILMAHIWNYSSNMPTSKKVSFFKIERPYLYYPIRTQQTVDILFLVCR